jgi:hypothetical protein
MGPTAGQISARSDDALFDWLTEELQRRLPAKVQEDRALYRRTVESLPVGLRAMAGIHFFDVSMTLDDLAWHFGNQNDEWDLKETRNGLRELELNEIADLFEKAWEIMKPHMKALRAGDFGGKEFPDWLEEAGIQTQIDPMNDAIWAYCDKAGERGLLESWVPYFRKHPDRCIYPEG